MKKPLIDKVNKLYLFVICVLFSLSFAACSESDENEDEYANWKERNDAYFNNVYNQAKDAYQNKDYTQALDYIKNAITIDNQDFDCWCILTEIYLASWKNIQ